MPLATQTVLQNRYRIVTLLGQGGMGAVYRAWDLRLEGAVAVKEFTPQPGLDAATLAQLRDQFKQEAIVLSRLNHPHLVRVRDFFEEHGNAYLVMDLVEGESLEARILRQQIIPEQEAVTWLLQLLDALSYCHNQGILHRDIKPQNVIIDQQGCAILVDFGLVKLWDPNDPQTRTVLRGMGTPEYAPPEQYGKQGQSTDPRSDLYSLGATFYHALTGQAPPTASDRMADPELFRPVRALSPQVSPTTDAVLLRALEPARQQRWNTANEMAAALGSEIVYHHPTTPPSQPDAAHAWDSGTAVMPQTLSERKAFPDWAWVLLVIVGLMGVLWGLSSRENMPPAELVIKTVVVTQEVVKVITATPSPEPEPAQTVEPTSGPPIASVSHGLGDTWTRPADGMVMVYVPAGEFQMGSAEGDDDEEPVHTVALDAFWLDRTEVTNAQFQKFVNATGYETLAEPFGVDWKHPEGPNSQAVNSHPVVLVSWHDAVAYCEWAGARLPTEAEWEYAARGPKGLTYPWGNEWDCSRGNFATDCGSDTYSRTAPVGSFPGGASWVGALDLAGNVAEWVADWYGSYPSGRQVNPTGPQSGDSRVRRGGSWGYTEFSMRGAYRFWDWPAALAEDWGFRCGVSAAPGE